MSHHTDADVQPALVVYLTGGGVTTEDRIRNVLDAVAPAIAARALREAADAFATAEPSSTFQAGWLAAEMGLRARAANIERGAL